MLGRSRLLLLTCLWVNVSPLFSQEAAGSALEQLSVVLGQVLEQHLTSCHLVFMTTSEHSPMSSNIPKFIGGAVVVVEPGRVFSQEQPAQDHLLQGLWGDTRTTCRALILDLTSTNTNNTHLALRIAEMSNLWHLPETRLVVVGGRSGMEDVILHHTFRNIIHAIYLVIQDLIIHHPPRHANAVLRMAITRQVVSDRVSVYRRCLYCNNGQLGIQFVRRWNLASADWQTENVFPETLRDFMGHTMHITTAKFFPYANYHRDTDKPGTTVKMIDCLDLRILETYSPALNFTYEIREEPNITWGVVVNGSFTGMMGLLEREEKDFSTIMAPTPERLRALWYLRGYDSDPMTLVSLKPTLLPKYLAMVRPFEGELWLAVGLSVVAWGTILWLLQKAWQRMEGGRGVRFSTGLLYGWGAVLEQPFIDPSVSVSGQVLVGWWLVYCEVIGTGYRSSLISHLTVQGKSRPLETFEDLVSQNGWKWGFEPWLLTGAIVDYFAKHTDPVILQVFEEREELVVKEALKRVLAGSFTLISFKNYVTSVIYTRFADPSGRTPFHIGSNEIPVLVYFGWGIRKGAPFYKPFKKLMSRLHDAGVVRYWGDDVLARHIRENREDPELEDLISHMEASKETSSQVVLELQHLQGAFYLLLFGSSAACLFLLGEILASYWYNDEKQTPLDHHGFFQDDVPADRRVAAI